MRTHALSIDTFRRRRNSKFPMNWRRTTTAVPKVNNIWCGAPFILISYFGAYRVHRTNVCVCVWCLLKYSAIWINVRVRNRFRWNVFESFGADRTSSILFCFSPRFIFCLSVPSSSSFVQLKAKIVDRVMFFTVWRHYKFRDIFSAQTREYFTLILVHWAEAWHVNESTSFFKCLLHADYWLTILRYERQIWSETKWIRFFANFMTIFHSI